MSKIGLSHKCLLFLRFFAIIVGCLLFLWLGFSLFGRQMVDSVYEGKNLGFLNRIVEGQASHDVGYYHDLLKNLLIKITLWGLLLCIFVFIVYLISLSKAAIALCFGLFLTIALILCSEGSLYLLKIGEKPIQTEFPPNYNHRDQSGILLPNQGKHNVSMHIKKTKEEVYNVVYSVDKYRRRIVPVENEENRDKFIMFIGCSYTFGEGVENNQTFAYEVGKNATEYTPYNYAMHGAGPFDNLARLEGIDYENEIKEKNGLLIYMYIDPHVIRTIGGGHAMNWKINDPYYEVNKDGELVRHGTFIEARPFLTRFYYILGKSRILRVLNIWFPLKITSKHIEVTAKTIEAMRDRFKLQYPDSEFYVLFYPDVLYVDEIIGELQERDIQYLDFSHLYDSKDPKYSIRKEDEHPSPLAHMTLGKKIVEELQLQ